MQDRSPRVVAALCLAGAARWGSGYGRACGKRSVELHGMGRQGALAKATPPKDVTLRAGLRRA
jgi:hypothetical protein